MILKSLVVALLLAVAIPCYAIGEPICWDINPFDDTFRVSAVPLDGGGTLMYAAPAARWFGPGAYVLTGSGAATTALSPSSQLTLSVGLQNNSEGFNGNQACEFWADLDPVTLGGTWNMTCRGEAPLFFVEGTLTRVGCTASAMPQMGQLSQEAHPQSMKGQLAGFSPGH
jgi:hypothetical protein